MRIVIGLCLLTFLVLVTANQDEGDNSLRRVQREPSAEGGQQNQGPQRRRANKLKRKKKSKKSRKLKNRKTKNRKNKNRRNKKTRRVGKFRGLEQGRQAPLQGTGCQYVNLLDIISRGNACENGKKFVMKGKNARRQFLIVENKVLLAFVTLNTKFTACTSFEDVTSSVNCKVVDGLSSVNLGATSQSTTAAASSTAAATTTAAASTGSSSSAASTSSSAASASTAASAAPATTAGKGCQCGRKKATRIVGGQNAEVNEWPWIVALSRGTDGSAQSFICGGTLIAEEWVITAAHCFFDPSGNRVLFENNMRLVLGDHDRSTETETTIREVFEVAQITLHPTYVYATNKDDIAIMKLTTKVDLNKHAPACLPTEGAKFVGQTAYAYGWGALSYGTGDYPDILQEVALPIVTVDACKAAYGADQIIDGMLCAGGDGVKDSCSGDSGGPLTVPNSNDRHVLVGATSYGKGCAEAGFYGVYADVPFYRTSFIDATINANGGATFCPA